MNEPAQLPPLRVAEPIPGAVYGFTTRVGGVSPGSRGSLDLASREGDDPAWAQENWRRALAALGPGFELGGLALLHQVHGAEVVVVRAGRGPAEPVAMADAAVTDVPGLVLAVRVADCVPVLLAGPGGVGVAHAGWRGAAAGVVSETVRALCALLGCEPGALHAVVGPHIGPASFEVGPEVVAALVGPDLPASAFSRVGPSGKPFVDLGRVVDAELARCGVLAVQRVAGDSFVDASLHSYRRDGAGAGRFAGLIAMVPC